MTPQHSFRQQGFTLIEALIVVAIVGVFLSLAAPSFVTFTASQRVKTASFDLYAALTFARSEAIKRRKLVTVAPVSADWNQGWTVSTDVGGTQTTLRSQDPLSAVRISSASASVVYRLDGRISSGSTVGVLIRPATDDPAIQNRCIRVDLTGLPKSTSISSTTCP